MVFLAALLLSSIGKMKSVYARSTRKGKSTELKKPGILMDVTMISSTKTIKRLPNLLLSQNKMQMSLLLMMLVLSAMNALCMK